MSPATSITAPTVIHGKPSPSVGRREPPPPPAVATLGSVGEGVDEVGGVEVAAVDGGVTVCAGAAVAAATNIPSASSPKATARRTGATVMDAGLG